MALNDYAAELVGFIPKLPPPLAKTLVNRAWRDIRDSRLWSFLVEEGDLVAPAIIETGAVSVTQFANTVTGDATASAAWGPQLLGTPPFTKRQFRVSNAGAIYSITAVDDANPSAIVLTLDRTYKGATSASTTYSIYRCYFEPPATDFLRYLSVYDPTNGYWLSLNKRKEELDRRDPLRNSQSQPVWVCNYKADSSGNPIHELWPHPTTLQGYSTLYQRRGVDLTSAESVPAMIPTEMLMAKAKMRAGMWAIANTGAIPELRNTDWRFFIASAKSDYEEQIPRVRKQDEETFLQNFVRTRRLAPNFPIDGRYLQAHAPYGPFTR